jgi:DNA primase
MDVIALVRAGFTHAVAPLGTALTEDQLQMLWRMAPEPILAFDGDTAGQKAAHRAAHLALPHLKAGHSLRFAFLPSGEDPDSFIAAHGAGAMQKLLDAALPLSELLWRAETDGRDFSTPERRAGLEHALREITDRITDGKVADYYRPAYAPRRPGQPFRAPRPQPGTPEAVSPAVRASLLARQGGARQVKEMELGALLAEAPGLALTHAEMLAALALKNPSLDRLRHELLNLAASGSSLEKAGVQTHFAKLGMADLLAQFAGIQGKTVPASEHDPEACFLRAAQDLREMADPDRASGRTSPGFYR